MEVMLHEPLGPADGTHEACRAGVKGSHKIGVGV